MTIPHDTENRWWVEAGGANPELVESFRHVLLGFLAFDKNKIAKLAGTGFLIASSENYALGMTAKHVFSEGVLKAQQPNPGYASSAICIPKKYKTPSLEPIKLKVIRMANKTAAMLNASHACYNDTLDIASYVITPQINEKIDDLFSIPLDLDVPGKGDLVHMVAMDDMDISEISPPSNNEGKGQTLSIYRKVSIRVGIVTGVYPQGYHQYKWPCFTSSIPAKPGMSGGFVYCPIEGKTIAACGIVCADNSEENSHNDNHICGESIIASTWPSLCLRVPYVISDNNEIEDYTIYEMIKRGNLPVPLGGFGKINILEGENGDCKIRMVT